MFSIFSQTPCHTVAIGCLMLQRQRCHLCCFAPPGRPVRPAGRMAARTVGEQLAKTTMMMTTTRQQQQPGPRVRMTTMMAAAADWRRPMRVPARRATRGCSRSGSRKRKMTTMMIVGDACAFGRQRLTTRTMKRPSGEKQHPRLRHRRLPLPHRLDRRHRHPRHPHFPIAAKRIMFKN